MGLAGSSAIVTATIQCLMNFYGVTDQDIPKAFQVIDACTSPCIHPVLFVFCSAHVAESHFEYRERGAWHQRWAAGSRHPDIRWARLHGFRKGYHHRTWAWPLRINGSFQSTSTPDLICLVFVWFLSGFCLVFVWSLSGFCLVVVLRLKVCFRPIAASVVRCVPR